VVGLLVQFGLCPGRFANLRQCCAKLAFFLDKEREVILYGGIRLYLPNLPYLVEMVTMPNLIRRDRYKKASDKYKMFVTREKGCKSEQ